MYIPDYFDVGVASPIDSRMTKATAAARDSIPAAVRFDGLAVYVVSEQKTYQLQGGTTNTHWKDISVGGGLSESTVLNDLYDVVITTAVADEQLLFNGTEWYNWPEAFIIDKTNGNVTTNELVELVTINAPIYNTEGGVHIVNGDNTTHLVVNEDGSFDIISENTITGDTINIINQNADGSSSFDSGITIDLDPAADAYWAQDIYVPSDKGGIQITTDGWLEPALVIKDDTDDTSYVIIDHASSQITSQNMRLGRNPGTFHGDTDRDFTATYDNVLFAMEGYAGHTGFFVRDMDQDENIRFQLVEGYATFYAQNGITQGETVLKGSLDVIAQDTFLAGDTSKTGYITAEDYIKTDTYFDGDLIYNHNSLELASAGTNVCKVADVIIDIDDYAVLELDYVLPDHPTGINKGKILLHLGYNSAAGGTEIIEVETEQFDPIDTPVRIFDTDPDTYVRFWRNDFDHIGYVLAETQYQNQKVVMLDVDLEVGDRFRFDGNSEWHTVQQKYGYVTVQSTSGYAFKTDTNLGDNNNHVVYPADVRVGVMNLTGDGSAPIVDGGTIAFDGYDGSYIVSYVGISDERMYHVYNINGVETTAPYDGGNASVVTIVTEEIEVPVDGDAFIKSLIDIKELSTGDTGISWAMVVNDTGTTKTAQLFAQLTEVGVKVSYNGRLKTVGTATINILDEQAFGTSLPTGTDTINALTTTGGNSYWSKSNDHIYNMNVGSVGIGKMPTSNNKLDVDGAIRTNSTLRIQETELTDSIDISGASGNSIFSIKSSALASPLLDFADGGDVFVGKIADSNRVAKMDVSASIANTYAGKFKAASSASTALLVSGGAPGVNALEVTDFLGNPSASLTGNGILEVASTITVDGGIVLLVNDGDFTYNGNNVWHDGYTGSIGDLDSVDLSGLSTNSTIRWDGTNWVPAPLTNGITNLSYTASPTNGTVISDTGDDAIIPLATSVNAGLISPIEKDKLGFIEEGAEANVQSDWNEVSSTSDAYIKNKPSNLSDFVDDINVASHIADTVIHVTQVDKDRWDVGEENVQADWTEEDTGSAAYINNKPTLGESAYVDYDTTVIDFSDNLITSGAVALAVDDLAVDPSTGFVRFGDTTIRLIQAGNTINITDVPRLASDGKLLLSQTRTVAGGATHTFADAAAVEASINGGTSIPSGDLIYTNDDKVMWIAAVDLTGPGFVFADAVTNLEVLDITTGANSYTQTQINSAFTSNEIEAGDGLTGGGTLAFGGTTVTLTVDAGNGLRINSGDSSLEIDDIVGTPTGTIYTP